jgi:hypothetical protein
MAEFQAYSDSAGWHHVDITDERGTLNRLVTPATIGSTRLRALGKGGAIAECLWVGADWLGVPENDHDATYIADSLNAVNLIFGDAGTSDTK